MTPIAFLARTSALPVALSAALLLAAAPAAADDLPPAGPGPAAAPGPTAAHPLAAPGASLRFGYAGGEVGREQVKAAIEQAIAGMSFLIRPFARSRITGGNRVFEVLTLSRQGERLVVDRDGNLVSSPADGSPVDWTGSDGAVYRVSQRLLPGGLVQTFTGKDAVRENTISFTADGGLRLEVVVRSGRLPAPLTYALAYSPAPLEPGAAGAARRPPAPPAAGPAAAP